MVVEGPRLCQLSPMQMLHSCTFYFFFITFCLCHFLFLFSHYLTLFLSHSYSFTCMVVLSTSVGAVRHAGSKCGVCIA
jgi:hypothetical protein